MQEKAVVIITIACIVGRSFAMMLFLVSTPIPGMAKRFSMIIEPPIMREILPPSIVRIGIRPFFIMCLKLTRLFDRPLERAVLM